MPQPDKAFVRDGLAYQADENLLHTVSSDLEVRSANLLSGEITQ